MSYKLTWMPDALLGAGLKVAECEGWRERGRSEMGTVRGVMCHHTGNPYPGNMPTLGVLKNGRPDLRGPLCNLGLGRDGTYYVVAAGRANHAGAGQWAGLTTGNSSFIGIEAEHSGDPNDPWPADQMEAYRRGVAALLRHVGADAQMCVAHKEYATPVGRKIDPTFEMLPFRIAVADYLAGKSPPPPIRAADEKKRPTLRRGGADGDVEPVRTLQEAIGVRADGVFGRRTEAVLRAWQRDRGLTADGICGPKTWDALSAPATPSASANGSGAPQAGSSEGTGAVTDALNLGDKGIALIKSFESCARSTAGEIHAYPDPGSRDGRPWTIGWGSTGRDIAPGLVWTRQQCDDRFAHDVQRYVDDVRRALGPAIANTSQDQFDALVSFHYNTGQIASATLTKRHKAGEYEAAAREFARWVRNDGKVMMGLVRRREAEADLYGTPPPPLQTPPPQSPRAEARPEQNEAALANGMHQISEQHSGQEERR